MRHTRRIMATVLLLAVAGAAQAQAPNGDFTRMREQFQKFRDQHKYTFQLRGAVNALGELEKGKKNALTPAQARKELAVIKPLQRKPKLTQDQAKTALKAMKGSLTTRQLTEISKISSRMRERGGNRRPGEGAGRPGGTGGPGGPGGRPGGPGARPGMRPRFDLAAMKDFNPFAPPKGGNPMVSRGYKNLQETISLLEKKAKQK